MKICYAGVTYPSAKILAHALLDLGVEVQLAREPDGDINWGRNDADTKLNQNIATSTNKLAMRRLFKENDVPAPRLLDFDDIDRFPIVARTRFHTGGSGLWVCTTIKELKEAKAAGAVQFLEYIDAPKEFRVHIFNGKSIRLSEKRFNEDRSDHEYVAARSPVDHVREAAKKAVEAVGLDFAAVDILANDTEAWVLEVNTAPQLHDKLAVVYARAIKDWWESDDELDAIRQLEQYNGRGVFGWR